MAVCLVPCNGACHVLFGPALIRMDRSTRMNVGYAFVNFISPDVFRPDTELSLCLCMLWHCFFGPVRMCQATLEGKRFLDKEDCDKRRSRKPIIVARLSSYGECKNEIEVIYRGYIGKMERKWKLLYYNRVYIGVIVCSLAFRLREVLPQLSCQVSAAHVQGLQENERHFKENGTATRNL